MVATDWQPPIARNNRVQQRLQPDTPLAGGYRWITVNEQSLEQHQLTARWGWLLWQVDMGWSNCWSLKAYFSCQLTPRLSPICNSRSPADWLLQWQPVVEWGLWQVAMGAMAAAPLVSHSRCVTVSGQLDDWPSHWPWTKIYTWAQAISDMEHVFGLRLTDWAIYMGLS